MTSKDPVIVIGAGLAGLVATHELALTSTPTLLLDQESSLNLGGQAFWSLGGLFLVDTPAQRRMGVQDSKELAWQDWLGSAQFDREVDDYWPRKWARAFVDFASNKTKDGEGREDGFEGYVRRLGAGWLFNPGWPERGDGRAEGHGNSVPRFHITWGTGPEVVRIFAEPVKRAAEKGVVTMKFRHMVDEIIMNDAGRAIGVRGKILEEDDAIRGALSSRRVIDTFELYGSAVLISSGGIGGNIEAVKKCWPIDRLGPKVPEHMVAGVPAHVDGKMMAVAEGVGAHLINRDRMWHYTEGLKNWNPIWENHGIRILPAPSSLWLDATGKRLPPPLFPGADTLGTLKHICGTGYDYSWFILNQTIIAREFALSGSEQNPDFTEKSIIGFLKRVLGKKGTLPVQNFMNHGEDFVVRDNLQDLVTGMNLLAKQRNGPELVYEDIKHTVDLRDSQMNHKFSKDAQAMLIHNGRNYFPDRRARIAPPHQLLDISHGPLIAVRLNILTRKTLGGLETNLEGQVMRDRDTVFEGLYAAGEASGFGGGGMHGYNSLEGTFLGGCVFSGRQAGRAMGREYQADGRA